MLLPVVVAPAALACDIDSRDLSRDERDQAAQGAAPGEVSDGSDGSEQTVIEGLDPMSGDCGGDAGLCTASGGDAGIEVSCSGCVIGGGCVESGVVDASNPCQICDPQRDPAAWSANEGAPCDDGLFCTTDDACAGTTCGGQPRQCEDGVECNGVQTCDEVAALCSAVSNQCVEGAVCDVVSDTCTTDCDGCLVDGVCAQAGTEAVGNPCLICDPLVSTTALSPRNGAACDDGAFCTVDDRCRAGQCVGEGNRSCGANRSCDEAANACQCQGCAIGSTCFASGAINPNNPCQVCDPARSASAFSANAGAACGAGPVECSAQDTCNAQGQCAPNHRANGTACASPPGGSCAGGVCAAAPQANGSSCSAAAQCLSGFCRLWFEDLDGDSFGNPDRRAMLCSPAPANDETVLRVTGAVNAILRTPGLQYSGNAGDCCDVPNDAGRSMYPDSSSFFTLPQTACPAVAAFDYNCSGSITDSFFNRTTASFSCAQDGDCNVFVWVGAPPACAEVGPVQQCQRIAGVCSLGAQTTSTRVCQ